MDRFAIADILNETGSLLDLKGGNPYKARAYINGGKAIAAVSEDIGDLISQKRLTSVPGIGPSLAASITEIYTSGTLKLLEHLKEEFPAGALELSKVPGLTIKRIQSLHEGLGIESIDELEQALRDGRVRTVKGFSNKLEATLLQNIESYKRGSDKILLLHAQALADEFLEYLKKQGKGQIAVSGQVRKWHEVVDRLEFVAQSAAPSKLLNSFKKYSLVQKIEDESETFARVRLADGITAELSIADSFGAKLLETTGSTEHYHALQVLARKRGVALDGGGSTKHDLSEKDIYSALGLSFVPPELRDNEDSIGLAKEESFDDLICIEDIVGMTHCHTTFSDGIHSVEQMAMAAQRLGMKYLTITDHSPLAHYAGGLTVDTLKKQWEEIDRVQQKVKIKLLKGTECDILADGALDYPEKILSSFDIIIASVHSRFKLNEKQMTARLVRCMEIPLFKIWGHPLGRLLLRRDPIACDVEKILDTIAGAKAAIEINGDPHRLDLATNWVRAARQREIKFVISTDAHSMRDYGNLKYGVHQARRAGVRRHEVLNAMNLHKFQSAVKPSR